MCGIAGVSRATEGTREMIKYLVYEIEERGGDSWGCTDGQQVDKWLGKITDGWRHVGVDDGMPIVVHTRNATVGAVAERNSHPWVVRKDTGELVEWDEESHALKGDTTGCVIGVHNGCIRNHVEMKARYSERASYEVDSTHVFGHIARGLPDDEIQGWGALVWFDDGVMKLARFNMMDLAVRVTDDGVVVVCSRDTAIVKAARMAGVAVGDAQTIEEGYEYTIEDGGVVKGVKRGFGGAARVVTGGWKDRYAGQWRQNEHGVYEFAGGGTSYTGRSGGRVVYSGAASAAASGDESGGDEAWQMDTCWKCQTIKVKPTELVCDGCFKGIQDRAAGSQRRVMVYVGE